MTGADLGHGFRLLELATVASTNDVARRMADAGEPAGLIVRAERQTAGRGRHGRAWQSPPGNLYASLLLRPTRPMAEVASLSLVVALALAEAVEELSAGRLVPRLKWPNDVLLDGAKLAGILLELVADPRRDLAGLIVGIGVNVGWAPSGDLPYPATSLVDHGLPVPPRKVLAALAAPLRVRLDQWSAQGFPGVRSAWLARAAGAGSRVEVRLGERVIDGRMLDVDEAGALRLEGAMGKVERFTAGEVSV